MYVTRESSRVKFGEWLRGRALAWGARDRGFDSRLPDVLKLLGCNAPFVARDLRGVAQMVARTVRDREVVGSNPAAPTI